MKFTKQIYIVLAGTMLALVVGCTDKAPTDLPKSKASLGNITISKYVAVGNSLAAGYQSSGLYKSAQLYSYPNLIAKQLMDAGANLGTFEQPYWPDPGNPDPKTGKAARYVIISLADPNNPVIGPAGEAPTATQPENVTLARPFDNLGLPGAPLAGFMDTVGTYQGGFGAAIIRGANGLPKSQFRSVKALQPQLVTFWLGNNDVLGYATTGGASTTITAPTNLAIFQYLYNQALDTLKKSLPNAKIVVATIPDVTTIPFFTTIGPRIGAKLATIPGAALVYQKKGEFSSGSGVTQFKNPASDPLICLTGSAYASLLGQHTGKFWWDIGYDPKTFGIDTTKPFGFDPKNPWPNALTLDSTEIAISAKAVGDFNATIKTLATTYGALVADINTLFTGIKKNGYSYQGKYFTADYITGGLFSLDGVHPSSRGAGVVANEFISTINKGMGINILAVDITSLPDMPQPLGKYMVSDKILPNIAPQSWDSFLKLWQN
jgi:lysophospholipase L1-like esterase